MDNYFVSSMEGRPVMAESPWSASPSSMSESITGLLGRSQCESSVMPTLRESSRSYFFCLLGFVTESFRAS